MVDYMLVEQSITLLTENIDALHRQFTEHPVFITSVSFTEEAVQFAPMDEEVLHEFDTKIVEQTIQMIKSLPRVLEDKNFVMLFEQPMPRGPDPTSIIVSTRALNSARRSCDMIVKKSFQKASHYAEVFEELRMVQHFKTTWDEKEYKAVNRDVQAFRQDMMLLKQWSDDVEAMKTGEAVGALFVDSAGMQTDLQATLTKALDVLKSLLTGAARKQCLAVLEHFSKMEKTLGDRPVKLEEFASFYATQVQVLLRVVSVMLAMSLGRRFVCRSFPPDEPLVRAFAALGGKGRECGEEPDGAGHVRHARAVWGQGAAQRSAQPGRPQGGRRRIHQGECPSPMRCGSIMRCDAVCSRLQGVLMARCRNPKP